MVIADITKAGERMRENDFDLEQKRCLEEDDEIDLGVLLRNFVQGMRKFWWLLLLLTVLGRESCCCGLRYSIRQYTGRMHHLP